MLAEEKRKLRFYHKVEIIRSREFFLAIIEFFRNLLFSISFYCNLIFNAL